MSLPTATAMSPADAPAPERPDEDLLEYRSVHTFAVLGVVIGLVSIVIPMTAGASFDRTLMLAPIGVVGLIVSLYALRSIAAAPELYTGRPLALTGTALSGVFLATGVGYSAWVYTTEVPDGYNRTSFIAMKPSEQELVDRQLIPDEVREYIESGEPVFLKGFIRPDSIKFKQNLTDFLLVRDNNQCCFGDLSKVNYFDQVQVELGPGMTTDFHRGVFRVGGKLSIARGDPRAGTPLTYKLDADYVKP